MYAEVVVLTYQAPDIGSFTYEIPKNLEGRIKIGQLVQVPFGKRNPMGIVMTTDYGQSDQTTRLDYLRPTDSSALPNRTFKMDGVVLFCADG